MKSCVLPNKNNVKKKDIITALEVTEKYLKVAQSSWVKDHRELCALKAQTLTKGTDDKAISTEISRLFRAKDIKKSTKVILCLPRYLVTTRYIKIPSRDPQEIEKIISLAASKYLPYPSEELVSRYYLIGQDSEGYSRILLVLIHRNVLNRYLKIVKDSGLQAVAVSVSSYGLYSWYLSCQAPSDKSGTLLLVDIDSAYQDLVVISEGRLVFTRSFTVELKPQDPALVNLGLDKILEEIKRSLITYQKENIDRNPTQIILTGSPQNINVLEQKLSNALSLPVKSIGSPFSSVIGLALGEDLESLDLTPKETREKRKFLVKRREWLKSAVLFIAALVILILGIGKNIYDKTHYLNRIKAKIDTLSAEAKSLEEIKNQLEIIKEQFSIPVSGIDALYEIYRISPPSITLNSFSFEEKERLVIKGQAQDLSSVFKFVTTLEESEYFKGVSVKNATKRKTELTEVADFEIICPLSKRR